MAPSWLSNASSDWLSSLRYDPWLAVIPLLSTILLSAVYWRGARELAQAGTSRRVTPVQATFFAAGLLILLLAVASPLDTLTSTGLAFQMVQNTLLVMVVPPLLLLGTPIVPLWHGLPSQFRRDVLRWVVRQHQVRSCAQSISRTLARPAAAWCLFAVTFMVWYIPQLYDVAQESAVIHGLEQLLILAAALAFWAQVLPSFPLQPKLTYLQRVGYVFAASLVVHFVSILISIAVQPIYPFYGTGPNVTANQSAGGAIMDVSGLVVFTTAILIGVWFWLQEDERGIRAHASGTPGDGAAPMVMGTLLLAEGEVTDELSERMVGR